MREQFFYGHGKLLLSGEYFILDGARGIALPTNHGQKLSVNYKRAVDVPQLYWKSYDLNGKLWFEATFELWHFDLVDNFSEEAKVLQSILMQARRQNIHFLRDEVDVHVNTHIEFPLNWGVGSSSSLLFIIAQWAYISPFELNSKTFGGSGYDIACAQTAGPISFELQGKRQTWTSVDFNPVFKDHLYFIHLNKKQNTRRSIERYREISIPDKQKVIENISEISDALLKTIDLKEFEDLLFEHEELVSRALDLPRVQQLYFADYDGVVKSLGAWGGDFVLATSHRSEEETKDYFAKKGYPVCIPYDELILKTQENLNFISSSESVTPLEEIRQ